MNKKKQYMLSGYNDYIFNLFSWQRRGTEEWYNGIGSIEYKGFCRDITFQVCECCTCNCSYCYQTNKKDTYMSRDTAKATVDLLFKMYDDDEKDAFINKHTQAIILDFIGGEPLMNIDIIDYICTYFFQKALELHHPWADTWRASISSNGSLYFSEGVQNFLKKFNERVSFTISIDGHKELHNSCRKYPDGTGNFDDAYKAYKHYRQNYHNIINTKITIAPENLDEINKAVEFFVEDGYKVIHANTIFEADWTNKQATKYYYVLKDLADYLLSLDEEIETSLFNETFFRPRAKDDIQNWCGGDSSMLAFDVNGTAFPCVRYMSSSLGDKQKPIVIGDCKNGIYKTPEHKEINRILKNITRRTQTTDECFNCPIAAGCADCLAECYQRYGMSFKKNTSSCCMHKARSLANAYYWNKLYMKNGTKDAFDLHCPKEWAIEIIPEEEYEMISRLAHRNEREAT